MGNRLAISVSITVRASITYSIQRGWPQRATNCSGARSNHKRKVRRGDLPCLRRDLSIVNRCSAESVRIDGRKKLPKLPIKKEEATQ